jgi:hypothetical protein
MGHGIVPTDAGWDTFGWLTAAFLVGTIIFALSLEPIIRYARKVRGIWDKFYKGRGRENGGDDTIFLDQDNPSHSEGLENFTHTRATRSMRKPKRVRRAIRRRDIELGVPEDQDRF